MSEELYGVQLARGRGNYDGRDASGQVKWTPFPGLDGRLMTRTCAEALVRILKRQYPQAEVTELFRGDRDELVAETIEDLGETRFLPLSILAEAVTNCVQFGNSPAEILTAVRSAL